MFSVLFTLAVIETPVLFGALTALFAPLVAYIIAVRQFSGKIESSDAKELWAESRAIRDWSQVRIAELNETVLRLDHRVETLELHNRKLFNEKLELQSESNKRDNLVEDLKQKIDELTAKLEQAYKRIAELEKESNNGGNGN